MTNRFPHIISRLLSLFLLSFPLLILAQPKAIEYRLDGADVIVSIPIGSDTLLMEEMLSTIGSSCSISDSLVQLKKKKFTVLGWELVTFSNDRIEYKKPLKELTANGKSDFNFNKTDISAAKDPLNLNVSYGSNHFKAPSVVSAGGDQYTFIVKSKKANEVYLAGTFNNWSTSKTPMKQQDDFWTVTIPLKKGKHLYKFIVNGRWAKDPANLNVEDDGNGHENSVFFAYNHTFRLYGFPKAENIYVAGSFNYWEPRALKLVKTNDGWEFPLYLREGKHEYKYIVDGQWMVDPLNPLREDDGAGNINSILILGETHVLTIPAFENANRVSISGDFHHNGGDQYELAKTKDGWQTPLSLGEGNYEYSCLVDGAKGADPTNPHQIGSDKSSNSILVVNPNHTFFLKGFNQAEQVVLSGTFNNWAHTGYTMKKVSGGWMMPLHLPKGKTRYKFIVDGVWMRDPNNPHYELNQYDTFDSVLWIEN